MLKSSTLFEHFFVIFLYYIRKALNNLANFNTFKPENRNFSQSCRHNLRHSHASLLIEMGFNILMVSQRLGHDKVETTWRTYAHLYPDKEKMLATQLDIVKIHGIAGNLSVEEQLLKFMQQFQRHVQEQPALIDISQEEIYRWDPETKEKVLVTQEEFENEAELDENIEAALAVTEIFQAGYLEICGMVYCLASRGLPMKFL